MSGLWAMAAGTLIADPQRRTSAKGTEFATATLRAQTDADAVLVSVIAFGEIGDRLLQLRAGAPVAVSGKASLRTWVGKDGATRVGLSLAASEIAAARPRPRPRDAPRRAYAKPQPPPHDGPPLDDRADDLYVDALQ